MRRAAAVAVAGLLAVAGAQAPAAARPSPRHHRVEIRDMAFRPARLIVAPGDTVTWTNRDVVPHTATGTGASWDSGELAAGASFTLVVARDGAERYACRYHPMMTASLVVR